MVFASCVGAMVLGGCKDGGDAPAPRGEPVIYRDVEPGTAADVQTVAPARYQRTLVEQLDLVPADTTDYLVIRDLRPLIAQARRIEQVLAGPLARGAPALAELSGDEGAAARVSAQLERARDTLGLILAGLEGAGIDLGQGLIVADPEGAPVLVFAASDVERLGALASLVGGEALELVRGCAPIPGREGWLACATGGETARAGYRPGESGEALAAGLSTRLGGLSLEPINVAVSIGGGQAPRADATPATLDLALRTDPGLWELSVPMPAPEGQALLSRGRPQALRALVPGTSFAWAQLDPAGFDAGPPGLGQATDFLTGELFLGAHDDPDGIIVQAGIRDQSEAARAIDRIATFMPGSALEPESLPGIRAEFHRSPIELDGKLVPSIGATVSGEAAGAWASTLGLATKGQLWAYGEYMTGAIGEVEALPTALTGLRGGGPSREAIAALPPTLARALLAGEVAMVAHLVLDGWQAPLSESELAELFAGLPEDERPSAESVAALLHALAPWSAIDLWLRATPDGEGLVANVSLVPFVAAGEGVDPAETNAADAALDAVLTGGDGSSAYAQLAEAFPDSPRAPSYRERLGQAPTHHGAVGMLGVSAIGALALPALTGYVARAKASEAIAQTQAIVAAAVTVHERAGGCESIVGEAGPTPSLSLACHDADGGRCRAVDDEPSRPGEYPSSAWHADPWATLSYRPPPGHRFHYGVTVAVDGEACTVTASAVGDLDGDGVRSVYRRTTTIAADGSTRSPPLEVENPDE